MKRDNIRNILIARGFVLREENETHDLFEGHGYVVEFGEEHSSTWYRLYRNEFGEMLPTEYAHYQTLEQALARFMESACMEGKTYQMPRASEVTPPYFADMPLAKLMQVSESLGGVHKNLYAVSEARRDDFFAWLHPRSERARRALGKREAAYSEKFLLMELVNETHYKHVRTTLDAIQPHFFVSVFCNTEREVILSYDYRTALAMELQAHIKEARCFIGQFE